MQSLKKLSAILLLGIFMFNSAGYWFVLNILENNSSIALATTSVRGGVSSSDQVEPVTLTVPISLAYEMDWPDLEHMDSKITFEGKLYRCLKTKVYQTQIVMLCLPEEEASSIQSAREEFFKIVSDVAVNGKGNKKGSSNTAAKILPAVFDIPSAPTPLVRAFQRPSMDFWVSNIDAHSVFSPGTDTRPPQAFATI